MKRIALLLLASIFTLPAQDNPSSGPNLLLPCDFSKDLSGWHGDGVLSNANASSNPLADQPPGPVTLDITLSPTHWFKVIQEFNTKYPTLNLTIQYKVSRDLAFSDRNEDYQNFVHSIGFDGWAPLDDTVGNWVILLSDFSRGQMPWFMVKPKLGSDSPQTFRARIYPVNTEDEYKTLTLAFPPGQGTISIINVTATP